MPRFAAIYRALSQVRNPSVDQALAAALPTARGAALRGIVAALLDRQDAAGQLGLVQQFHRLSPDSQNLITTHAGQLFRAVREAALSRDVQAVSNAVELIRRAGAAKLAYLIVEQLRHGSPDQKTAAAACLLELTRRSLEGSATPFLMAAVYEAVAAFAQHRQPAVLLAAAEMLPRGLREVIRPLSDTHHAAFEPWLAMLRHADEPAVRRSLILMLSRPSLAEAATDGFRRTAATPALGDLVATSHYLALPGGARGLATLSASPIPAAVFALRGEVSRGVPAIVAHWPADRAARITALTALHAHPDPGTRISALRTLIRQAPPAGETSVTEAVSRFRHDAAAAIARAAATYLIRVARAELPRVLAELVASPHDDVRRMAALRLGPRGFAKLWESWPRLDPDKRLAAGRALIKLDPHFHRLLSEKLLATERPTRMRALAMITALGQGAFFEPALVRLLESDDPRVASAAVRALGTASGDAVRAAAERALHHPDPRVRANAVETLAASEGEPPLEHLAQMTDDPAGRPRANAIAALMNLRARDAVSALKRMLADARPGHRASALWLVQAAGVLDVARQVGELAVTDPDRDVQRRARLAVKRLITLMAPAPAAPEATGAFHEVAA